MSITGKVTDTAAMVVKEVYNDAAKPAVSQIGKTAGGLTRIVLAPLNALVWGYDKIAERIEKEIDAKLSNVPKENIDTPPAYIVVPAIEALRYTGEIDELRNLFSNLIANSIDSQTISEVHPSFVEIIKLITPDEAKILTAFIQEDSHPYIELREKLNRLDNAFSLLESYFTKIIEDYNLDLQYPSRLSVYFDNLIRIGLLNSTESYRMKDQYYLKLENHEFIHNLKKELESRDRLLVCQRGMIRLTSFGKKFIEMVVVNKN